MLESLLSFSLISTLIILYLPFLLQNILMLEEQKADVEQARVLHDAVYKQDSENYQLNSGKWHFRVVKQADKVVVINETNNRQKTIIYTHE